MIEYPQIVVRSGWYGVCPGDCYCQSAKVPLSEYPKSPQYWEITAKVKGTPIAKLKYRDVWCPLYMDYLVLTGLPYDFELELESSVDMSGAVGGPQILFPAFMQLYYDKSEGMWKAYIMKEVQAESGEPPCCTPKKITWGADTKGISSYGIVEIVEGDDPRKVTLKFSFFEPDDSTKELLECDKDNFLDAFPYGCCFFDCQSASYSEHPDWVSKCYFGAFTNLAMKSCWNSQIYQINLKTGEGTVSSISSALQVEGEPIVPKQCWPDVAGGIASLGLLGIIISKFKG